MLIDGLQKTSLIDYPGKMAAIIFTFGCNFHCGFCHNPQLVYPELRQASAEISEENILEFLKSRRDLLDALVITGGEPTLQLDLPDFIKKVRALGFLIKLDTNGSNPEMVTRLIKEKLVDFWAMDIKNIPLKYSATVGKEADISQIEKSIKLIKESGADYEFRTTVVNGLHTENDILGIAQWISGAQKLVLQKFVPHEKLVDQNFIEKNSLSDDVLKKIAVRCEERVKKCEVR